MESPTAGQLSPGRDWWWTGTEWVAAAGNPDAQAAIAALFGQLPGPAPDLQRQPAPIVFTSTPSVVAPAPVPSPVLVAPVVPAQVVAPPAAVVPVPVVAPDPVVEAAPVATAAPVAAAIPAQVIPLTAPDSVVPAPSAPAVAADDSPLRKIRLIGLAVLCTTVLLALLLPRLLSHSTAAAAVPVVHPAGRVADARAAAAAELAFHRRFAHYSALPGLIAHGFTPTRGVLTTVLHADRTRYCVKVTQAGHALYVSSAKGVPSLTPCR